MMSVSEVGMVEPVTTTRAYRLIYVVAALVTATIVAALALSGVKSIYFAAPVFVMGVFLAVVQ
jgi:hypothetical protein